MEKQMTIKRIAKELFAELGFKKTNIARIMKACNMATGTFYNFYTSKDQIFMEIYLEENTILKKKILAQVDLKGHPMTVMEELMTLNEDGMKSHEILKEWYNKETFGKVEKAYREANGEEHSDFMNDVFSQVVKKWQDDGLFRSDIPSDMIMAMFSALINIDTHKDEIGVGYFPEILGHMSEFIMYGLMKKEKHG